MQISNSLLAQMHPETTKQIADIHQKIEDLPYFAFYDIVWLLPVFTALVVLLLFLRQKKMAQSQKNLAEGIENLAEGIKQLLDK